MHNRISSAIACFALILFSIVANAQQNYVDMTVRNLTITGSCTKTGAGSNSCGNTGLTGPTGPTGPQGPAGGDNGCINPVDPEYGADPTGATDSSPAFNAAELAACTQRSAVLGITGNSPICVPAGNYTFYSPILSLCSPTPSLFGAGKLQTIFINEVGRAVTGGGPLLELDGASTVSSFGGPSVLIQPGLTGGGGNSFNWGTNAAIFDLNDMLGDRPLNGLAAFDVQVILTTTTNSHVEYAIDDDGGATTLKEGCSNTAGPNSSYTCKGAFSLSIGSDGKLYGSINTSVTGWTGPASLKSASAIGTNTTILAELSYDGTNVRMFHGTLGSTSTEDAKVAQTGTLVEGTDKDLTLGGQSRYWRMIEPDAFWQGKMDSVLISNVAGCTNDSGCAIANAKLTGNSNSVLLENWSHVSNLPLVEPEYINGSLLGGSVAAQSWMAMYNYGLGNSGGNYPSIEGFSIGGGTVGIHATAVSPHIAHIDMQGSGIRGPEYGIMLETPSDYDSKIDDVQMIDPVLPIDAAAGIIAITRVSPTCGVACIESCGGSIKDALLLPPSSTQWGIIACGQVLLSNVIWDTENGGTDVALQLSNMLQPSSPMVEVDGSDLVSAGSGVPPIAIDGQYQTLQVKNSFLSHTSGTGVMVDLTDAQANGTGTSGIDFNNDAYDLHTFPSGGNSYVSATDNTGNPVGYSVTSTGVPKVISGTAGNATCAPAYLGTSKQYTCNLNGYQETSTAQTYPFPIPFTTYPSVVEGGSGGNSCGTYTSSGGSLTALTLPANASMSAETCSITVTGQ